MTATAYRRALVPMQTKKSGPRPCAYSTLASCIQLSVQNPPSQQQQLGHFGGEINADGSNQVETPGIRIKVHVPEPLCT